MSEHTKTPWHAMEPYEVHGPDGFIADCFADHRKANEEWANARHIVHCVNTHDPLVEVLEAYKQWEADVILNEDAWGLAGMAERPILTQALWDRLIEIQAMRNAALTAANATDDGGVS